MQKVSLTLAKLKNKFQCGYIRIVKQLFGLLCNISIRIKCQNYESVLDYAIKLYIMILFLSFCH